MKIEIPAASRIDAVPVPPLRLESSLYGYEETARCGYLLFGDPGTPSPSCSAPNGGGVIVCK